MHIRMILSGAAAALLCLAALPAPAQAQACVNGVDCFCDKVQKPGDPLYDPNNVFCEDFEDANLDENGAGGGWTSRFGAPVDGCWQRGLPNGQWVTSVEGTCPTCCVNVVKESGCEVAGQTDCVFQGGQSLGHRYRPGETGGIVGAKSFRTGTSFGVTMAVKYSRNYVNGNTPKKSDEFSGGHCLLGCSSGTYVSTTAGNPFHGVLFWTNGAAAPTWTNVVGRGGFSGVAFGWYPSVPTSYDFSRDHGLDTWRCWKLHIANVGQSNATIRHWIDDRLLVHLTNVDLRNMLNVSKGFNEINLNNYYNGGYPGSSIAYRYEDNIAVTVGPEPLSCAAIGMGSNGSGGGGSEPLGSPGRPILRN